MDEDKPLGPLIVCYKCGSDNFWFDRTICPPCDSMHNVCSDCASVQPCGDEACEYGPWVTGFRRGVQGAETATSAFKKMLYDEAIEDGRRIGLWRGVAWALGIEAVIAGLVVLVVKVV